MGAHARFGEEKGITGERRLPAGEWEVHLVRLSPRERVRESPLL